MTDSGQPVGQNVTGAKWALYLELFSHVLRYIWIVLLQRVRKELSGILVLYYIQSRLYS